MIIIDKLTKYYNNLLVLNNISLRIAKGEVIAITGPSGSGKSTLLRCIANLDLPSSGTITIDGISSLNSSIYEKIGMVFQHFNLFPHMDVMNNLIYTLASVRKMSKDIAKEKAYSLLKQVGLTDKAYVYPANLSGGQKQRVAIARTLMLKPEVILFDEPTSALDPENVKEVLNIIKNLAYTGVTILIVTHELSFARDTAERLLFFDHGNIIEDGMPKDIFQNPNTERARTFFNNVM
ncbi:Arginine transport ATP-binding protein ArtM [Rickettsiales bacterium Ac37b]|nr:Arginine transport ATP-binding protein ArtM [Rickettsiales bacterium Ac37b]